MVSIFSVLCYQLYCKTLWCRVQWSKFPIKIFIHWHEYIEKVSTSKCLSKTRDDQRFSSFPKLFSKGFITRVINTFLNKPLFSCVYIAFNERFLLFLQCFPPIWRTFHHFRQFWSCCLQTFWMLVTSIFSFSPQCFQKIYFSGSW